MEKQMQTTITIRVPRFKRRAVELYGANTPFKPKMVKSKKRYARKPKYKKDELTY